MYINSQLLLLDFLYVNQLLKLGMSQIPLGNKNYNTNK